MNLNKNSIYIESKEHPIMTIDKYGNKIWKLNDKLHREDGHAIEYANGSKYWYLNHKLHREDGPALESASGNKYWYLNGKLHRENGPAEEYADGNKYWYLNGKLHREDGPAVEYADGTKYWYLNGVELTEEAFNEYIKAKQFNKELASKENTIFSQDFLDELIL
jgi:hypothetical protein